MATWSAFGLGGFDPIGSIAEGVLGGELNSHYTRNMADFNAALGYEYAEKYAKNNPSWQRKGLEDAGYNPLLAVSSGVASPFSGNVDGSISDVMGNQSAYSFDAQGFANGFKSLKERKAVTDASIAQANAAKVAANLEKEIDEERLDALRGLGDETIIQMGDDDPSKNLHPKRKLRGSFIKSLERDNYMNDYRRVILQDVLNALQSGASAFSSLRGR